jgi:uncharacterized protein YaaN involved in tellurite resistance
MDDEDRTASLMSAAKLAQISKPKAPVSPAAWLDKMAADAGHPHVRRLAELRADLQVQATRRDLSPLAAAIAGVAATLPKLDFAVLQQKTGFFARLAGKSRTTVTEFASQFDSIDGALDELAARAKALQASQGDQASRTEMTLVEFEVEFRALEKIIDQGARWLHDMRTELKEREARGGDEATLAQIRADGERCELLVARLKNLRSLSSAAQASHQQARSAAARRAALVDSLRTQVAAKVKDWRTRIEPLATSARNGEVPTLGLEGPMDRHRDMQLCIKEAAADCGQMQSHEQSLAENLDSLGAHLQAVG